MSDLPDELRKQYREALGDYLVNGGEEPLHIAYELGRRTLSSGGALLDIANMYHTELVTLLRERSSEITLTPDFLSTAGRFLLESLSPFAMLQLGHQEANAALRRLNEILEEEAKRIAHVLHDEAAQFLATVYLELSDIERNAPDEIRASVGRIEAHLDMVREQLRRLSHELRPPILDRLGLLPALEFLADGVRERSGLEITVEGSSNGRFPQPIETTLYRVVQEALNNVTRHAQATRAKVHVWSRDRTAHCTISDDGIGFQVSVDGDELAKRGLGLIGIRERVGTLHGNLTIRSTPDNGTELRIAIPLVGET